MKSSREAEPPFPNRRRFGRMGGLSVKSLGGFWQGSISERTVNIGHPKPTTSPQIRSARRSDPIGHHERKIRTEGRNNGRYDSNRQSTPVPRGRGRMDSMLFSRN